ncbi:MAG TPA: dTMP kinase [Steroidobacteraceae bacterium]|nr:dTMP kinase [Steroidobacteraceae bacterium]
MTETRGRFLTIEGIEGVGKTTQVARLSRYLADRGIDHVVTREPGGTPFAEKIRDLVLRPRDETLPPAAELLLMFAARAVHLANHIEPVLNAGRWVICDRFTDATYAYQGAGRGMSQTDIRFLETLVQGALRPDLTLLLDVPVDVGLERSRQRDAGGIRDRFDGEKAEFFERVRDGYLSRARAEPQRVAIIDAAASMDEVTAHMTKVLESRSWIS